MSTARIRPQFQLVGAFGFGEVAAKISGCDLPDCELQRISHTDFYCYTHSRFLPFSGLTNGERAFILTLLSCLIYGCMELTAHLDSVIPVDMAYAIIGLIFTIILPLRKFKRTVVAATFFWLVISGFSLTFQFTTSHFHVVTSTVFLFIVITISAILSMDEADAAAMDICRKVYGPSPGGATTLVACGLIGLIASGLVGCSLIVNGYVWHGNESAIIHGALIGAACFMGASILAAIATGFIYGPQHINRDVPAVGRPQRPRLKTWRREPSGLRPRPARGMIERIAELATFVVLWTSEIALITSIIIARVMTNFLLMSTYILIRLLVDIMNQIVKLVVLTIKAIVAALATAIRVMYWACVSTCQGVAFAAINMAFPVGAFAVAALFVTGAAAATRHYIFVGSIVILLDLLIRVVTAFLLASTAWMALASQDWRKSLISAQHSASITAPYLLLFVALGGWLLGLPGTILRYGRLHVGWLTFASTSLIVIAVLLRPALDRSRRAQRMNHP